MEDGNTNLLEGNCRLLEGVAGVLSDNLENET